LQDVSAFEELPKRVGRVGQTAMREGVSLEKVTKFIVDGRLGNRPDRKKRRSHHQDQHAQSDPTQRFAARKAGKPALKSLPQIAQLGRRASRNGPENCDQYDAVDEVSVHVMKRLYLSSTISFDEQRSRVLLQFENDFMTQYGNLIALNGINAARTPNWNC
jgi:hypothetical protein